MPNIIYEGNETSIAQINENFDHFIKNSYNQDLILKDYFAYKFRLLPQSKIVPIFNETFVFYKGKIQQTYKKQYILNEDVPMMKNSDGNSYLGKKNFIYTPGIADQKIPKNLFNIEICQDHDRIDVKRSSRFLIVQSATINPRINLADDYIGTFIHADIEKDKCNIYNIIPQGNTISTKMTALQDVSKGQKLKVYDLY